MQMTSTIEPAREEVGSRYSSVAQSTHWITAALMFAVLPLGWEAVSLPMDSPSDRLMFTLHKSIGLTILAIVAFRIGWRAAHPAPPLPGHLAKWERAAAFASHWLLYLILVGMPISGYVLSTTGGHTVPYFWLFDVPPLPKDPVLEKAAQWVHVVTGQWFVYALIVLHLLATAWHVAMRRDGVLNRMLPAQDDAGWQDVD